MAENDQNLSHSWYWDARYALNDGETPTHEWFRSFADLEQFFGKFLLDSPGLRKDDNPLIIHLGSGDSVIPAELDSRGYKRQICVDFSPKVVEIMTERHKSRPGIIWKQVDVRDMGEIADRFINVAFDKGTMDAMIHGSPWSPPPDVKENTGKYLREVHRVLQDDGIFLYVTFRQPHFIRPLLDLDGLWNLDMEVLSGKGSFDYYGWVLRKASDLDQRPGREVGWRVVTTAPIRYDKRANRPSASKEEGKRGQRQPSHKAQMHSPLPTPHRDQFRCR